MELAPFAIDISICSFTSQTFPFLNAAYGGGSGGRIAVYVEEPFRFRGQIQALGGMASNYRGGPGTVYKEIESEDFASKELEIDNNENNGNADTVSLKEDHYEFDAVTLLGGAKLEVKVNFNIRRVRKYVG